MRQRRRVIISVLLAFTAFALIQLWRGREPGYQGRSLTRWLQQCSDTPTMETNRLNEAQGAVRAIGAKRALPILLQKAEANDGPLRSWVLKQNERLGSHSFKMPTAEDTQQLAIAGFEALETNCAPAVRELTRLLADPNHSFTAMRCLVFIGKPAEASICSALTNGDWRVREFAVSQLAWVVDDVEIYLTRLKDSLKDTNSAVRFAVVQGIGAQTAEPDLAIPLLLVALQDADDNISAAAVASLADFGTNARRAFAPLTNAAAGVKPATARAALKTLVAMAPTETLPIVFNHFRSVDPSQRRQAFGLLCAYPLNSEIQAAIEMAVKDSDSTISRKAQLLLTEQYRKNHPDELPGAYEPAYGGKRLGEWLQQRHDGYTFSNEAEDAIRHMGTNAIPALLARLVYTQPPFGLRALETNTEAMAAFLVLGEQAKSVLPKLSALMEGKDEHLALLAMMAACRMGEDTMPCLLKGLTNFHANVRGEAVGLLTDGPGPQYPQQRKLAVPVLIQLLHDPDESVRMNATNALKEIDPAAAATAGVK